MPSPKVKPHKIKSVPSETIKEVARGIATGQVFTDRHVPEHERNNLPMIFMPIALGAMNDVDLKSLGLLYENLSEALPRSVNGMPIFGSFKMLNKKDAEMAFDMAMRMRKAMDGVSPGAKALSKKKVKRRPGRSRRKGAKK